MIRIAALLVFLVASSASLVAEESVTLPTLLDEMVRLDRCAGFRPPHTRWCFGAVGNLGRCWDQNESFLTKWGRES